jgi:hypothetical protein
MCGSSGERGRMEEGGVEVVGEEGEWRREVWE